MRVAGIILALVVLSSDLYSQINITNVSDLEFGVVQQNANGSATSVVTPQFGAQFNINGLPLLEVSVSVSTATLVLSGGSGVTVSSWVIHATNSQTYTSGPNILTTSTSGSTSLSLLGTKTLWLGGTLAAAPSTEPGSYNGVINIEVAYNL